MDAVLTWLDLTASDREKMRRVLDLFSEQGTIDELGLGRLRDAISNELFPGTSSIQTRLRYMLFIPWLYQRLEAKRLASDEISKRARESEIALIGPLLEGDDVDGVIGGRARGTLRRLPSAVYWAGLARWGIFCHPQSQGWYHAHFAALARAGEGIGRADDPGVVWTSQPSWHRQMPQAPKEFPWKTDFALTPEEADFIRGRIQERCAGRYLAWLASEGTDEPAEQLWDEPSLPGAPKAVRETVELARRFSRHVEGAPLVYNLMLAEKRDSEEAGDPERAERYRAELEKWGEVERSEEPFDAGRLWALMAQRGTRVPARQLRFVESWCQRVAELGAAGLGDDDYTRQLIGRREIQLKGGRARLQNESRLLDWSGSAGVGRMVFRWPQVRQLLVDLHRGLAG